MTRLTKAEKVALAEAQVKQAELMVVSSRNQLDEWLSVLELRQEYLESITQIHQYKGPAKSTEETI